MAALVTSGSAELFRIVVYGDSNTYGWIPNLDPPSTRYSPEQRWPGVLQKELGSNFQVIEEGPEIEKGPTFGEMFKEGVEKSRQLPSLYEAVAKMGGAEFSNAGAAISTDGVDGLHFTSEAHRKLGAAIAAKVKEISKLVLCRN